MPPGWGGTRGSLPSADVMGHHGMAAQPPYGRSWDVPLPGDPAGRPLCSGPLPPGGMMGHLPPQPQCGRSRDMPMPGDAFGYGARPPWQQASGHTQPGHSGAYAQHMPAQPHSMERPFGPDPRFWQQCEDVGCPPPKGQEDRRMPTPVDRLPTPAKSQGAPPTERSMGATERSMANGFKDSTKFVDAGFESEAEFLSTRSMPPPRRKKGEQGGRVHRQPDEASCMSCITCGW